ALRLEIVPEARLDSDKAKEKATLRITDVEAELVKGDSKPQKISFSAAAADRSNENSSFRNAIDGKGDTDWSLTVARGESHVAVLALKEPVKVSAESKLTVRLKLKGRESERALRRFRISGATDAQLLAAFFPVRIQPWKVIGPFKTADAKTALDEEFPPEKELDFEKSYPGVRDPIRWNDQPGYEDGKSHVFVQYLHGINGAYYFARKVHASHPARLEISLRADDFSRIWLNGKEIARQSEKSGVGDAPLRVTLDLVAGENQLLVKVVNHQGECRFRFDSFLADPNALPPSVATILAATATPTGDEAKQVLKHYRATHSPEWRATSEKLALWREELDALDRSIPTTLVAKESSEYRETRMLMRGEYDQLGEVVARGVPAVLPPFPSDAPTNRLGFAKWLVQPDHPLVARVVVNRFWQQYFGVGLVKTTEDFGLQSEPPSHPALLDWLATEFIASGWDVKHIQRLILNSATYRQSSAAPPSLYSRDPENRLIARGPRFRVDAETLRDTALALGGLLVEQIGGPSVKPYQPPGLWEAVSFNNSQKYEQDHGEDQYRRSLYIHWKRQSPPPNMLLFDAPTREYCVVRRPRTNTPLQALAMLNDPQIVEASRAFGYRLLCRPDADDRSRLAYAFRLATSRNPSDEELSTLLDVLQKQQADFARDAASAQKFLSIGEWKPQASLDQSKLAAWTTVASILMNLDETVTKN
ncbi:MAG TPA: DUF1553 domain-containing protein, partial [Candidatus Kapabacteria bacterium]|nr:DUF1553 domain-containing protein [Candidatus Kapabacteria bacterium]